uniref:Uncharacterized protein n=1 Tax=Klebsiella pneumoniae TaxID=573 RepID=A0A2P1BNT5_KLEPN|nr:hypothetical protein [Klebsiella pneumoniae]
MLVTPLRRTALKRVKVISGGRFSRSPHKVKTAAPATQRVMVLKAKQQIKEIHYGNTWRQ